MKFINYFDNLKKFKYKKEIIKDINTIYRIDITDKEYNIIINKLLNNNIIDKSSKKGKCSYISVSFLKSKNFSNGIDYFNSLKNKKYNIHNCKKYDIKKEIPFDTTDCIIELNIMDKL